MSHDYIINSGTRRSHDAGRPTSYVATHQEAEPDDDVGYVRLFEELRAELDADDRFGARDEPRRAERRVDRRSHPIQFSTDTIRCN